MGVSPWSAWHHDLKVPMGRHEVSDYNDRSCRPFRTSAMYANKSMGFRPWLQHAAVSRLVAILQNSISLTIQSYRSNCSKRKLILHFRFCISHFAFSYSIDGFCTSRNRRNSLMLCPKSFSKCHVLIGLQIIHTSSWRSDVGEPQPML